MNSQLSIPAVLFRIAILSFMLLLPSLSIADGPLKLIPYPQEIIATQGNFVFTKGVHLIIADLKRDETRFTAQQLAKEIRDELGLSLLVTTKASQHSVYLGLIGRDRRITAMLRKYNLTFPEKAGEEGYILKVDGPSILIAAKTEAGLFYGVQTLKQLIRGNHSGNSIPAVTITDWPALRYRGWMDDISRGPIPTVEFVKECIRNMAEFKQNYFTLYTENTFQLRKFPDLAPPGSFTADEVAELTDYAARYHMDMVGNFQSFGHMEKILGNPFYASLRESGNILNPADESTYKFLGDIYSEIVPAYKSRFFNINCDETQGLGEGKSKAMADSIGIGGIYAYHINRISKLMKPYGKRLMMWGDIAVNNQTIIDQLPKDLVILSWGYGAEPSFDNAIIPFKNTGFDFMVAPGVGCWGELWPAITNAAVNINNYVRDGVKLGAMGMMNTAWDDNGHNLFNYNWHGLTWGAECSWNPASPLRGEPADKERNEKLAEFNTAFDALFFETPGVTDQLILIDSLRFLNVKGIVSEGVFWQDILDFYPGNTGADVVAKNLEVINKSTKIIQKLEGLRSLTKQHVAMIDGAEFALKRVVFAAQKNIARVDVYKAYKSGDANDIRHARKELNALVDELFEIKKAYIGLWNLENRAWWLDKNLNDYNNLAQHLEDAGMTVFIEPQPEVQGDKRPVLLRTLFNDQTIVYTLNGTNPDMTSTVYTEPLMIQGFAVIKACVPEENGTSAVSEKAILMHKGIGNLLRLNSTWSNYNPAYAAGGDQGLIDGLKGSSNFADGRWQGYSGQDLDIELDFKKEIPVNSVSADFLQSSYSWILLPKEVQVLSSKDGLNYETVKVISHDVPQNEQKLVIHTFKASFDKLNTRYLRVIAKNPGPLPAWHHAAGNPSFIFCDEIIVE